MATQTKAHLIEVGTQLFLERGYHGTGLKDILAAANVPKGSFYHYFTSKEDFALQVVDAYGVETADFIDELLADDSRPPYAQVRRFFEVAFEELEAEGCRLGCLMGTLGQELAAVDPTLRSAIHEHLEAWSERLAVGVQRAIAAGELPGELDPRAYGRLLIDGFEGAALRMRLERGSAPLGRFMAHFFAPAPVQAVD